MRTYFIESFEGYWNCDFGWTDNFADATSYSEDESNRFRLPIGRGVKWIEVPFYGIEFKDGKYQIVNFIDQNYAMISLLKGEIDSLYTNYTIVFSMIGILNANIPKIYKGRL